MEASNLNIRHLAAMAAVVERGSVSRAARSVNLTQPAVTQGIAKLEQQLGAQLFQREPGGMTPTEAAFRFKARVDVALRLIGSTRVTAAQIRAFVALARAGSYAASAASVGMAEASLHRAIGDLSVALGTRLVERRGRGVMLTGAGVALARRMQLALGELRQGLEEVGELCGKGSGRIVVGAMPLSRAQLVPRAITDFRRAFSHVQISVVEGSHAELVGPLRDGEIDMMIGALRGSSIGQDLREYALFEDRPTIFARSGHPLRRGWQGDDLRRYPWILPPEGTPLRRLWTTMIAALGGELPVVPIECGSVMTVRQLLLSGDYLTLLSVDQLRVELEGGLLADIGPAPGEISRTIGLTSRSDWRPTRPQQHFMSIIEQISKEVYS